MMIFKKSSILIAFIVCTLFLTTAISFSQERCTGVYGGGPNKFSLATGSPGELGIIKALAKAFSQGKNITLCWIKAGSGDSLKLLKEKKVDMIVTHAPEAEKKAVAEGWAAKRTLIGSNEFYIVGPANDPAEITKANSAVDAYFRIASIKALFFSRGDNSGTHKREMDIWRRAGVTPSGEWYVKTKDFMVATLKRANSEKGYFMTDSSTWIAEKKNNPALRILFRGDKVLVNIYHALCQPPNVTPGASLATEFIDFLASEQGQRIIRDYGKDTYGEGFYNDASYARQYGD